MENSMINDKWGVVALENGIIQAGKISEHYILGEQVLKVEFPTNDNRPNFFEYHNFKDIKAIRASNKEEADNLIPNLLKWNRKID